MWSPSQLLAYKREFLAIPTSHQAFYETSLIFKRLNNLLGDKEMLFKQLSSLDILAYAYLMYQLSNTAKSEEAGLLRS